MLSWTSRFGIFLCLDSCEYADEYGAYDYLVGVGNSKSEITDDFVRSDNSGADELNASDWRFGHICYDYKNEIERKLVSRHAGRTGFDDLSFFVPHIVCYIRRGASTLIIESLDVSPDEVFDEIQKTDPGNTTGELPHVAFTHRIGEVDYKKIIEQLRSHIREGDCYEINFCTEGYSTKVSLDPLVAYKKLQLLSPAPFSAFYRNGDSYMMCASPERFIQKNGAQIISQPIKGTARRGSDAVTDQLRKQELRTSIKEMAENVMIVDLVRNDLAKSCKVGSVDVPELFGIYTYPQVHQMVSTVKGELQNEIEVSEIINHTFPMGSMTGAPKYRVMQLIDQYEESKRELFSGTVGYITPEGDFDFNVVIRSLFYNASTGYLAYQTGGAITWDSTAEGEWEEMRLKAEAIERIFQRQDD